MPLTMKINVLTILFTICSLLVDIEFLARSTWCDRDSEMLGNEKTAKLVFIFKCMRSSL